MVIDCVTFIVLKIAILDFVANAGISVFINNSYLQGFSSLP